MKETEKSTTNKCPYISCPLYNAESAPLKLENHNSKILLVFQAPGITEWKVKAPIQNQASKSSAGSRVHKSWQSAGKKRRDFNITNAVLCYPGFNNKRNRDNRPNKSTMKHCSEYLKMEIGETRYSKIICFGAIAAEQIANLKNYISSKTDIIKIKHPCAGLSDEALRSLWK